MTRPTSLPRVATAVGFAHGAETRCLAVAVTIAMLLLISGRKEFAIRGRERTGGLPTLSPANQRSGAQMKRSAGPEQGRCDLEVFCMEHAEDR
jgi:hypothetical protein